MTTAVGSRLVCAGCGAAPPPDDPYPFRCPHAREGDDVDHVITRMLDDERTTFPAGREANPFVRYRTLLHSYHRARAGGIDDARFIGIVERLDEQLAVVAGHGMRETPFFEAGSVTDRLGDWVYLKDETVGVAGSHKARHLFGLALHLEVSEHLGLTTRAESDRRGLAIASCGNAALAAATIARALHRPLTCFIPPDANPFVVGRLRELGARIVVCERTTAAAGDPCLLSFRHAVAHGVLPFCCQGSENGLTVEGGSTLAWEIASSLQAGEPDLGRLFVQVGGGALASACHQGLREARLGGAISRLPRLHAVQTKGAFPLRRAYLRVRERILARLGIPFAPGESCARDDEALADRIRPHADGDAVREELAYAARHRSQFMWPWETTPHSVAHGILDDETYDWHAVVAGMIESGGYPVVVSEERLLEASAVAREETGVAADATGAAGLAGLLELRARGLAPPWESCAALLTGATR